MQQLLFDTISDREAKQDDAPAPTKRGPGRPPRSPEEKARIAAERDAKKGIPDPSGGYRMGAGRPRADGTSRFDEPGAAGAQTSHAETLRAYNESRAKREAADAIKAEVMAKKSILEYEVQQGNYLPRDAIISATARAYAALTQGIRSIPDMLERRLGLDPSICVKIGELQDEALASMHADLEKMLTGDDEQGAENGQ